MRKIQILFLVIISAITAFEVSAGQESQHLWTKRAMDESKIYSEAYIYKGCHIYKHRNSEIITIYTNEGDLTQNIVLKRSLHTVNVEKKLFRNLNGGSYYIPGGPDLFYLHCLEAAQSLPTEIKKFFGGQSGITASNN